MKNETKRIFFGKGKIIHFQTIFLMWILLLFQLDVMAQERTISGTVTGTDGTPLVGVSVVAKGTTAGTLTDADGKFSFSAPTTAQTLVFSFVGMETREIPITSQSVYDVTLSQSTIGLDEVVVIGYGTQRKSDLTGSVVRVNMDQKSSVANVTLSSALKGVTAGVNVGGEGTAGSTPDLSIRGKTSLSATDNH